MRRGLSRLWMNIIINYISLYTLSLGRCFDIMSNMYHTMLNYCIICRYYYPWFFPVAPRNNISWRLEGQKDWHRKSWGLLEHFILLRWLTNIPALCLMRTMLPWPVALNIYHSMSRMECMPRIISMKCSKFIHCDLLYNRTEKKDQPSHCLSPNLVSYAIHCYGWPYWTRRVNFFIRNLANLLLY